MVADKTKKLKVAEKAEILEEIDGELVLSIEKLQEAQDELEKINEEASDKVLEIEQKYNEKRKPLYAKRNEIIKAIPDFWITAFLSHPALGELLNEEDQKIFKYLSSLEVEDFKDVKSGYSITFNFNPNPYFEDTKLTKTYTFLEEGTTKITATPIQWKEGKGIPNGVHEKKGNKRPPADESFFSWFSDIEQKDDEDMDDIHDEIAELIKDDLWPNPLTYFNNEEPDEEDVDEEDGDDEQTCQPVVSSVTDPSDDKILPPSFPAHAKNALPESSKGVQIIQIPKKSYLAASQHAEFASRRWGSSGSSQLTAEVNMVPKHISGTTTLGLIVFDGIIIAIDSRASKRFDNWQKLVPSHDTAWKVWQFDSNLLATMAGDVNHLITAFNHFQQKWDKRKNKGELMYTVEVAASKLATILVHNKRCIVGQSRVEESVAQVLLAGRDMSGTTSLYYVDSSGADFRVGDYNATGSGAMHVKPILEQEYNIDLTVREGLELARKAMCVAATKDYYTGGIVTVILVGKYETTCLWQGDIAKKEDEDGGPIPMEIDEDKDEAPVPMEFKGIKSFES